MTATFRGFRRADGRVGVRNHVLVLSLTGLTGPIAARAARDLDGVVVAGTPYGSSHMGLDRIVHERVLRGLACHPNCAATVLVSGNPKHARSFAEDLARVPGRPVHVLTLNDHGEDSTALARAIETTARGLVDTAARNARNPFGAGALTVAIKDGRSDYSIGIAGNPVLGAVVDRLIDAGATVLFGETTEWIGAEHLLAVRAATPRVAEALYAAPAKREAWAVANGLDLLDNNPGPTNIAGGLSTIEEKALGGVIKTGTRPIQGVLETAATPPGPGLWAMDTPSYAPECLTSFAAAGAALILFTTGAGNPAASLLAPTLKISARQGAPGIDVDVSACLEAGAEIGVMADRVTDRLMAVASGAPALCETLGLGQEAMPRHGPTL